MTPKRTAASIMMMTAAGLAACDGINDPSQAGNLVPKTVDEDPAIPSLALAGTVFHYETFGDPSKPAIIFLHGGPGVDFRGLMRLTDRHDGYALTDDHFVVMWDQRGSGLSRRHDCGVYNLAQMDADLDALVDHVSPGRPVVLIGHSWGGMYAADVHQPSPRESGGRRSDGARAAQRPDVRCHHQRPLQHRRLLGMAQRRRLGRPVPDPGRSRARRLSPDARRPRLADRSSTRAPSIPIRPGVWARSRTAA